jgi:hypothetical protein
MKQKRRDVRPTRSAQEKVTLIIVSILVAALVLVLAITINQRLKSLGAYRNEYTGRIMDKWVTYHESELGTRISRHLLIKSKNGEVFQVSVSPEVYEQAQVNLWVMKDNSGIRFLAAEP